MDLPSLCLIDVKPGKRARHSSTTDSSNSNSNTMIADTEQLSKVTARETIADVVRNRN